MLRIFNSYLVELNFQAAPTSGTPLNFISVPMLEDKFVYAIECVTATQMAISPTGKTMATQANAQKATLTIANSKGIQLFYQIPNDQLITQNNAGIVKEFFPIKLDLQKCFVQVNAAGISAAESICYNFIYLWPDQIESYLTRMPVPATAGDKKKPAQPKR